MATGFTKSTLFRSLWVLKMVKRNFISIVSVLLPFFLVNGVSAAAIDPTATATETTANTYDYIVVGSGPGGGPLAARLAQAGFSVALIDAGEDHGTDVVVEIPAFQATASEYPPITWQFFVDHYNDSVQAQRDEKFTWRQPDGTLFVGFNPPAGSEPLGILYPRTGTFGGCFQHNALIAIYPAESDWQNIATITGDSSWAPDNMRKYWERLENNEYLPAGTSGYGFSGWLDTSITGVTLALQDNKIVNFIRAAAMAFGKTFPASVTSSSLSSLLPLTLNSPSPSRDTATGLYQLPISADKFSATAKRASHRQFMLDTANAVNADGSKKFKLDIKLTTFVTKLLFDHSVSPPRAIGVNYLTGTHLYRADPNAAQGAITGSGSLFANKEVIVAGGVFNTPQLLKLSGIGPKAELAALKIPLVLDAPAVGTNMQDRYELGVTAVNNNPTDVYTPFIPCTFGATADDPCLAQWLNNSTDHGPYSTNLFQLMAVQKSSVSDPSAADLILGGVPANFFGYWPGYSNLVPGNGIHWTWTVLKAHSRNTAGTVTLTSADPRDTPKIQFNSFAVGGDLDLQATYEGVALARSMIANVANFTEERPGPSVVGEAATKQWIKDQAWGHHASCTVPIGATNDPNSVLDSNFRVKGISGLRVVDASAFPKIPSLYIVTAVAMISEKAADVIIAAGKS